MSNPTVVLITGVSSGIGRATAEQFAQKGCRVFGSVEPFYTKTQLEANSPQPRVKIAACAREREIASRAVAHSVNGGAAPDGVASTVVEAALGPWRMRHTPAGRASLLSKLRRFTPAGPVDASVRKALGLA